MIEILGKLYNLSDITLCEKISDKFIVHPEHSASRIETKYGLEIHYGKRAFFVFPTEYRFYFDSETERDEKYNEIKELK